MTRVQETLATHGKLYLTLFWGVFYVFCILSLYAMGRNDAMRPYTYALFLVVSFYVALKISPKLFRGYFIFNALVAIIYAPQGINYGELNFGIIISLMNTDLNEAGEYLKTFTIKTYLFELVYIAFAIGMYYWTKRLCVTHFTQTKGRTFKILALLLLIAFVEKPIRYLKFYQEEDFGIHFLSQSCGYYPFRMVTDSAYFYLLNKRFQKKLQQAKLENSTWEITNVTPKHQINVMIIGESMRRDYMSLYGYPLKTTPFLDRTPAIIFDNYISPGGNTPESLRRSLFLHEKNELEQRNYANSVSTLATKAGFESYWLSNKIKLSRWDTPATAASVASKHIWFNDKKTTASDLALLPEFNKAVDEKTTQPRLITLHLVGSHYHFCSRLDDAYQVTPVEGAGEKPMDCYLTSYRQTDELIRRVYEKLQDSQQSFSILYFSDHGLSMNTLSMSSNFKLIHSGDYQSNFEAPALVMSSDTHETKRIKSVKSGYYFMNLFADWLGIEESHLSQQQPHFFEDHPTPTPVKVFNFEKVVNFKGLSKDNAILPK